MRHLGYIFFLIMTIFMINCNSSNYQKISKPKDINTITSRGDISRSAFKDAAQIPLYQGNGRFGCLYGQLGLHHSPVSIGKFGKYGVTQFMHYGHFFRGKYNNDYLLPLARIYWENEPQDITSYNQHQSFYDGTITTSFSFGENSITVTTWFDPVDRNIAGYKIDVKGNGPNIIVAPLTTIKAHYGQTVNQQYSGKILENTWQGTIQANETTTDFVIKTDSQLDENDSGIAITLHEGENTILLSVNGEINKSANQSLTDTQSWWNETWQNHGWVDINDNAAQKIWVRSIAYFLSSFNDDGIGLAPPCGLAGNLWPFAFPQDLSYIFPVFLSTGHLDIAKSMIEYYANRIEGNKAYTKRLFKTEIINGKVYPAKPNSTTSVDGVFCPWVYPYGDFENFHYPTPPNRCMYEIHNTGYLSRMAFETSVALNNPEWSKTYAEPLISETALFYKSICTKEADGYWHIFITPAMGQDEMGGINQKDYLDALYGAQYCFQKAVECGLDPDGEYQQILKDGLAFPTLVSPQGYYFTCEGQTLSQFGTQKHPPQLNALAFLPVGKVNDVVKTSYNLRYELTDKASTPFFWGWTMGEFLLAGSRMGDVEGWKKDWDNVFKADYMDPDYIQIYESSKKWYGSFYITTHGLFAQTLIENIVSTWNDELAIGHCMPWEKVRFGQIHTQLGVDVSGKIENNRADLVLKAWKDTEFRLNGKEYVLKKGQTQSVKTDL